MKADILGALLIAYALRAAYTAGVIKSWLMWSGKPYDALSFTWPVVLWRGWRTQRGG